jgi:hypothetical protein
MAQHDLDLSDIVRRVIDSNVFMVLGTVDEAGRPWVSPVFYAAKDYVEFYWISSPEVTHSVNIARDPRVSIVIFNSEIQPSIGEASTTAAYMAGTAAELAGGDVAPGLETYPGAAERGGRIITAAEVSPPGPYRLYRATVSQHSILCPRESGQPCDVHGRAYDHRTVVSL